PPARPRRAGRADFGSCRAERPRELRLPEPQSPSLLHRLRERRLCGARGEEPGEPGARPRDAARLGRSLGAVRPASGRALGGRSATRRDRARARPGASTPPLRRADRPSRLRHERPRARAAGGAAAEIRFRARRRHPRSGRRLTARARGRAPRRAHRPGAGRGVILLALRGLARAPRRSAARVLVLAAGVALLGAMLIFSGHSLRTMTGSAVRSVPLGWRGPVGSYDAAFGLARGIAKQPGIVEA